MSKNIFSQKLHYRLQLAPRLRLRQLRFFLDCKVCQNFLTASTHHHDAEISTYLLDACASTILLVTQATHNLLSFPVCMLQNLSCKHLTRGRKPSNCRRRRSPIFVSRVNNVDELFNQCVCGFDFSSCSRKFCSNDLVLDQFLAEGFSRVGMDKGILDADASKSERRGGQPQSFVVEV